MANQLKKQTNRTSTRLYRLIRARIETGILAPGERLPSTRALATDLGVARSTIVVLYEQLAAEGFIETAIGKRARIAMDLKARTIKQAPALKKKSTLSQSLSTYGKRIESLQLKPMIDINPRHINFLYGAISDNDFPKAAWRKHYQAALLPKQPELYYRASEGEPQLRMALQNYLFRARGLVCNAEQILIVNGTQQALSLCAKLLVEPGQRVVMEEPCYGMARYIFAAVGAEILATPVDDQGLMTDALPRARCALAYVTPSHQYPLGAVMSASRRQALLAWAKCQSAWIIEDDYDSEFRYGLRPVDPLQSFDLNEAVIYLGTFSKTLSPQLRLGYLVLPPSLITLFRHAKQLEDRHVPVFEQRVLADFIDSGAYERHVRRLKRNHEKRRSGLINALATHFGERVRIEGTQSGLHIVLWVKDCPHHAESALVTKAKEKGVGLWSISSLYAEGTRLRRDNCAGFVLGYASLTVAEIEKGVRILAKVLSC